jgi:hypothetical protein
MMILVGLVRKGLYSMNIYDMMCELIKIEQFKYKCRLCGNIVVSFDTLDYPSVFCQKKIEMYPPEQYGIQFKPIDPETDPDKQVDNDQIIDNIKKCSPEEIDQRFAICNSCEYYKNSTCEKCGCYAVRDSIYMNKLAWKDQECPIGKWKKLL